MQHLTPQQAYDFLQSNPEAVFIDVRSEMEYMFVGHPAGSMLIPWVDGPDW
jgi:rhodanese-related sulfurtransferase